MGQQQLLLVILVTIIVGIATLVAINTFSSANESANVDAVRQDVITFASSAQGYYMKPTMLGGGGNSFNGITFKQVAFPAKNEDIAANGLSAFNSNGLYTISTDDTTLTVTAIPSSRAAGPMSLTVGLADATNSPALVASITPSGLDWTANN